MHKKKNKVLLITMHSSEEVSSITDGIYIATLTPFFSLATDISQFLQYTYIYIDANIKRHPNSVLSKCR